MERWSSRFVVSRSCVHVDGLLINSTSFVTVPLVLWSIYRGEWFLIFRIVPGIRKLLDFAFERRVLAGDVVRGWNWLYGCRLRHGEHERLWLFKFSGLSVSWNTSRACFVNLFVTFREVIFIYSLINNNVHWRYLLWIMRGFRFKDRGLYRIFLWRFLYLLMVFHFLKIMEYFWLLTNVFY